MKRTASRRFLWLLLALLLASLGFGAWMWLDGTFAR